MKNRAITIVTIVVVLAAALFLSRDSALMAQTNGVETPDLPASPLQSTTCNSCTDCSTKLQSGTWHTVTLTTDITNHGGSCVSAIMGESNVVFDCAGHTIDGDDIAIDPEHGVTFMHGTGNTIKNCVISDFSNGIYLWDAASHTVTGNTLQSNDEGIELGWSDSNDISNNAFTENYTGIRIGNSNTNVINANYACQNDYLDFNLVSGTGNAGDENTCDAPDGWNDTGTTGCTYICAGTATCTSCSDCTSKLNGTYDKVMLIQDITNQAGTCITFGASNVTLDCSDRTIDGDDSGTDYGVTMSSRSGNTVSKCHITDFYTGIALNSSSGNTVTRSSSNSNTNDGITLSNSSSNILAVFNEVSYNSHFGIFLSGSDDNDIYFNTLEGNGSTGIRLASSTSNIVTFNTVSDNTSTNAWGLYLYNADGNTISSNQVVNNFYGIKFDASDNNTLNSNKICSNPDVDFDLVGDSTGNSGDNNTCCANPAEWNDQGTTGCTNPCDTAPDANDNGISDACDCADARQGLNETGIDCGGLCPACLATPSGWSNVTGVRLRGAPNSGQIDVVFVPETNYTGNLAGFETAVIDNVGNWLLRMHDLTGETLPTDYQDRFNFYRYTGGFGVQANCAGNLPTNFWSDAPGADFGVILAPAGSGAWGCTHGSGPPGGHIWMIALAGRQGQVMHEVGHGIFGLVDHYCSDSTSYRQKTPTTNVWSSLANCQADATAQGWTDGSCTQIASGTCTKSFWKYDDYSLMDGSVFLCPTDTTCAQANDAFLEATMWRMNWVFANWPAGHSKGVLATFHIKGDDITLLDAKVVGGHPDVGLQTEDFRVELVSGDAKVLQAYGIQDPRIFYGDLGWQGEVALDDIDFSLIFPYVPGTARADIRDPQSGEVKASVDFAPLECTCTSCADCQQKLEDPACLTVRLTEDIVDQAGGCIGLIEGQSNLVFDCDGHRIDGDGASLEAGADPEYGIVMRDGAYNTIRNCTISDYTSGVYLIDTTDHVLTGNSFLGNGTGIRLNGAAGSNVSGNRAIVNDTGILLAVATDSTVAANVVCQNRVLDFSVEGGSGNTGDDNTCDEPDGWNDAGATGCTHACAFSSVYLPVVMRGQ